VLFVGHLSDRMTAPQPFATPWSASKQLRSSDVEAMQQHLTRVGLYSDKVDGKVDCWPSETLLRAMAGR
jgi:hypothetical protein